MKHLKGFVEYLVRLAKKWIEMLLLAVDLVGAVIVYRVVPEEAFPREVFWGIGISLFLVAGYRVYAEQERETRGLEQKIRELENSQPQIVVRFEEDSGRLVERIHFQLHPLPARPDFDILVEGQREQLLAGPRTNEGGAEGLSRTISAALGSLLFAQNPNYENEVEEYLGKYRCYLVKRYERAQVADRTRSARLVITNHGQRAANNVTVEMTMPAQFVEPARHQYPEGYYPPGVWEDSDTTEEEIRELEDQLICGKPDEPKLFEIPGLNHELSLFPQAWLPEIPIQLAETGNTIGPLCEDRGGVPLVTWRVGQLVQHRPEDDFEPLFIWLGEVEHSATWEIPVRITSADLRTPQKQTLFIEIEVIEEGREELAPEMSGSG